MGRALEVESAHDSSRRAALVILYESYRSDIFVELLLGEGLEKISSGVFKYTGPDQIYSFYFSFNKLHC